MTKLSAERLANVKADYEANAFEPSDVLSLLDHIDAITAERDALAKAVPVEIAVRHDETRYVLHEGWQHGEKDACHLCDALRAAGRLP